jgi:hypothetical protein
MSEILLDDDFDPDQRELCPDGNCTGVLDANGKCKVCGAAGEGSRASAGSSSVGEERSELNVNVNLEPEPAFDEDRQLCADGNCTGLIGSDGKCKVCGLAADATTAS